MRAAQLAGAEHGQRVQVRVFLYLLDHACDLLQVLMPESHDQRDGLQELQELFPVVLVRREGLHRGRERV